jgi:MFS family permease
VGTESQASISVDYEVRADTGGGSAYAPLRRPVFRALWVASLASNVGTWLQNVGAGWLITDLTPSPLMAALVQAATTLPVFLLALPAGALADVIDRRRLLLAAQVWMLVAAAALAGVTTAGVVTPWQLLSLTFALGLGFALNAPAWQAVVAELVPRAEVPAAVALNGVSVNASRAVGPAVGGCLSRWQGRRPRSCSTPCRLSLSCGSCSDGTGCQPQVPCRPRGYWGRCGPGCATSATPHPSGRYSSGPLLL